MPTEKPKSKQGTFTLQFGRKHTATRYINTGTFKKDKEQEILEKCKGIEEILDVINAKGSHLWKVRSSSKWFRRKFNLNIYDMKIKYSPSAKNGNCCTGDAQPHIDIADISEVRRGWKTNIFNKVEADQEKQALKSRRDSTHKRNQIDEACCFSIIYGERKDKTLDLVAPNPDIAEQWVKAIEHLIIWYEAKSIEAGYELWLRKMFNEADSDKNECLTFKETLKLLFKLNIDIDEAEVKKLFDEANTRPSSGHGKVEALDEDEFLALYFRLVQRSEIEELFKTYALPNGEFKAKQLRNFLREEQGGHEGISLEDCHALIQIYEHSDVKSKGQMTSAGFLNLLLSSDFDLFNYKEHKAVFQDMSQPLSHYYIASSHNTYIVGNQFSGESSLEGYIEAFKKGCKCVELDCWDGDNGEPIIWHGHTLMTKISFREVLEDAIKPFAFIVSKFPVILSLEVHCSFLVRQRMAFHLKEVLGDLLYLTDVTDDMKALPSPEELSGKILIKAKKKFHDSKTKSRSLMNITGTDGSSSKSSDLKSVNVAAKYSGTTRFYDEEVRTATTIIEVKEDQGQPIYPILSDLNFDPIESEDSDQDDDVDSGLSEKSTDELTSLVNLIQAVKFRSFEESLNFGKCYQMSSFSESLALKYSREKISAFREYNKRQLSRVYPSARRALSSNFNPIPFYRAGCQIVALNYQTQDVENLINAAMFRQNGGCGYVLKPEFMRAPVSSKDDVVSAGPCQLKIRIISGQHLPKAEGDSEVVDPYVELKIMGSKDASGDEKFSTKKVQNNGFNPVWNETFEVRLKFPELAFVGFRVRDYAQSGADVPLGYYVTPFTALATGYRHIRLQNIGGEPIPPATLFVHVSINY